eukprot:TRINITY_DN1505_c0_g1_i2.p2 TRINITY_DN1505_c0_g1~~TRINITY_DN1505_c0_g1_i2.p2  ORF type:complete len:141 (+),score=11.67 TRINITY_DN1505_c0_g1_i2:658-1080(+)
MSDSQQEAIEVELEDEGQSPRVDDADRDFKEDPSAYGDEDAFRISEPQGQNGNICFMLRNLPKDRRKPLALAVALLLLGVAFLIAAIVAIVSGRESAMVITFFVLSGITLIPGVYQSVVFYKSMRHAPGYSVEDIPNFDD